MLTLLSLTFKKDSFTSEGDTSSFGTAMICGGASIASASVAHWRPDLPVTFIMTMGTTTGIATRVAMAWGVGVGGGGGARGERRQRALGE